MEETTTTSEKSASAEKPSPEIVQPPLLIRPRTHLLVFMAVFYTILVGYILFALFAPGSDFFQIPLLFDHFLANFLFLASSFVLVALGIHAALCFCCKKLLATRWFRPKFGKVCVCEGCISNEELRVALAEQKRRIGETLVCAGRITQEQLKEALRHQKAGSAPLGQLLRELGYSTEEDIDWALSKMGRKLGEILVEKEIITKDDIIWLLGQQTGPRRI
jgi:hypothetical protein